MATQVITPGDIPITTPGKHVTFDPVVKVAMLPQEQRTDAKKARKGLWKPAPVHDEIWDGDLLDFREQELTLEELKVLLRKTGNKRSSFPKTLRSLKRLFSVASEKLIVPGKFGGVDVVSARARISEDFDEDEREEVIPDKPLDEIKRDETTSSGGGRSSVRVSYVDFDQPPPQPPPPSSTPPRGVKTTRFVPSPPPGPSPAELKALEIAAARSSLETNTSETRLVTEEKPPFPKQPILARTNSKGNVVNKSISELLLTKEVAVVTIIILLTLGFINRFIVRITVLRIIGFLVVVTLALTGVLTQSKGKFEPKAE